MAKFGLLMLVSSVMGTAASDSITMVQTITPIAPNSSRAILLGGHVALRRFEGCVFEGQEQHYIDQELVTQLGGQVSGNFASCQVKAGIPCKCTVPEAYVRTPASSGAKPRRYVEIGADTGIMNSNTHFFDKTLGWEGICVEARPDVYAELQKNRPNCININAVVSKDSKPVEYYSFDESTWVRQMSGMKGGSSETTDWAAAQAYAASLDVTVTRDYLSAATFAAIFKEHKYNKIDFMSVDVEGGEMAVLSTIDFSAVDIHYMVVEANEPTQPWKDLLKSKGFSIVTNLTEPNHFDLWFVNNAWTE